MRKRDKISLLNKIKKLIQNKESYGLCYAWYKAVNGNHPDFYDENWVINVIELGVNPPKIKHTENWWWPMYDERPRIRAINRAIKRLQS